MELENIDRQAEKKPLDFDFVFAAGHEPSEFHIFFGKRKIAFSLNGAVHPEQFPFVRGDLFLHRFPLRGKPFRYIQDFVSLFQRFLASVCVDAFLFQRASGTLCAFVYGRCQLDSPRGSAVLFISALYYFPVCADIGIP